MEIDGLKQFENSQYLATQLLRCLSNTGKRKSIIGDIIALIKNATEVEAVGIRLQDHESYPYYETVGFPPAFLKTENLEAEKKYRIPGEIEGEEFDSAGKPVRKCMCGTVIHGQTDPSKPFFTERGSFWTDSVSDLLAPGSVFTSELSEKYDLLHNCFGGAYESIALIPILSNSRILGLLQLNDSRKGMITHKLVNFLEDICPGIGIAFKCNQTDEALLHTNRRIRKLLVHVQETKENERREMAGEIHDGLGQTLTAIKMELFSFREELNGNNCKLKEKVQRITRLIDSGIEEIRKVSSRLRSPMLDGLTLSEAVKYLVDDFKKRYQAECSFVSLPDRIDAIESVKTTVFRIVQESLSNISKHSRAKEVVVSLKADLDTLTIRVEDNGTGITENQITDSESFGIMGMREHCLALGGKFTMKNCQPSGTRIMAIIPDFRRGL